MIFGPNDMINRHFYIQYLRFVQAPPTTFMICSPIFHFNSELPSNMELINQKNTFEPFEQYVNSIFQVQYQELRVLGNRTYSESTKRDLTITKMMIMKWHSIWKK